MDRRGFLKCLFAASGAMFVRMPQGLVEGNADNKALVLDFWRKTQEEHGLSLAGFDHLPMMGDLLTPPTRELYVSEYGVFVSEGDRLIAALVPHELFETGEGVP